MRLSLKEATNLGLLKPDSKATVKAIKPVAPRGVTAGGARAPAAQASTPKAAAPRKDSLAALGVGAGAPYKNRRDAEGAEQVQVIEAFRLKYPQVGRLLIHIPNGGSRSSKFEGWRLKQQGVRAGVSDLLLPVARGGFHGLWIEFKATPPWDSPASTEQLIWLDEMRAQSYEAKLCLGQAEALIALDNYMALPHGGA